MTNAAGTGAGPARRRLRTVVVAALTYRRAHDLAELLPLLVQQAATVDADVRVLIVDNDPEAGARPQVEAFGSGVEYAHAPVPGIAAARNVALERADSADGLVFIDDDERPVAEWLHDLLATAESSDAAAVVGPVVSEFSAPPEPWVASGRFFDRRRLATGTRVEVAATNNLLLDLAFVRSNGLRFDERFGLSGGSDTLFTRQLHRAGGRLVWCDEAVVTDIVPPDRLTRQWVLQRAFRSGNSWARTSIALADSRRDRVGAAARVAVQGLPRIAGGAARWGAGAVLRDMGLRARGIRSIARGAGMTFGAFGLAYVEYKRTKAA